MSAGTGDNRLAVLAAEIRDAHRGVEAAAVVRATHALDAGRALLEAKGLLKHGRWLPWLKDHCRLPERTAQLYMKLAKLDLPPELIAALGMERAAQSEKPIQMGTMPHPLAQYAEPVQIEWTLFAAFVRSREQVEWIMRQGFTSPDDWMQDDGYRKRVRMPAMPEDIKARWADFREKHAGKSREAVEALAEAAG